MTNIIFPYERHHFEAQDACAGLTITEAAEYLDVSRKTIYRLLEQYRLILCPESRRIPLAEIEFEIQFRMLGVSRRSFDTFMSYLFGDPDKADESFPTNQDKLPF